MAEKKKIYIAGFDVFLPEKIEIGKRCKSICEKYGFEGLYPLDNEISPKPGLDLTSAIFYGNLSLIQECDIIVANLNPFRGAEIDSGTAFECGVSYSLAKKLYGYIEQPDNVVTRVEKQYSKVNLINGILCDKDGASIENFGLYVNLMIGVPFTIIVGNFEKCIAMIKENECI